MSGQSRPHPLDASQAKNIILDIHADLNRLDTRRQGYFHQSICFRRVTDTKVQHIAGAGEADAREKAERRYLVFSQDR